MPNPKQSAPTVSALSIGISIAVLIFSLCAFFIAPIREFTRLHLILPILILICVGTYVAFVGIYISLRRKRFVAFARTLDSSIDITKVIEGLEHFEPEFSPVIEAISSLLDRAHLEYDATSDMLVSNRIIARELQRVFWLLDSMDEGLLAVDSAGKVIFANWASGPFLKCPAAEACGQPVDESLRHAEVLDFLTGQSEEGSAKGIRTIEISPDEESETGHVMVIQSDGIGHDDQDIGQLLVFRDISQIKEMKAVQSEFVDSVSHELRTPLSSIRAYVEMLIDDEADDPQMKYNFYNTIYEETYRLSELINNLLNISMVESGSAKLDIKPTRIKRLLEEGLDVIRPQCEKKDVTLIADLPDRLPTLDIDKSLFSVSVMNILSNAAKYTPDGGTITLTTSSDDDEFKISVEDSGIGIPQEDLVLIFEKFYRSVTPDEVQGSGVGLATAQQIIKFHGGDIHVSSTIGEGSTFSIVLPRTLINTSIGD